MQATNRILQARKLPVIPCLLRTYRNVLARPVTFLKLSVLPGLAVALLLYAYAQVPPLPYGARGVLFLGFLAAPLSYLGLAWLRSSMLGERGGFLLKSPWAGAFGATFRYSLPCFLWFPGSAFLVFFAGSRVFAGPSSVSTLAEVMLMFVAWLGLVLPSLYVVSRLLLVGPAAVAGLSGSPFEAWHAAAGQSLRLFGAVILLGVSLVLSGLVCLLAYGLLRPVLVPLLGYLAEPIYPFVAVAAGGSLFATVLFAELFSIAYRHLTGWCGPADDVVRAFD